MGRWAELSVEIHEEATEAVLALLIALGTGGVLFDPGAAAGVVTAKAYLPDDPRLAERLEALRQGVADLPSHGLQAGPGRITLRWVEDEDWAHSWKAHFHPLPVGRRWLIQPSWESVNPGDRTPIRLDPGMAFGTGRHPTTRQCLELLEDYVQVGNVCADVGTGSGILAIAAALLGASRVVGVDLEPVAVQAARTNAEANGVADRVHLAVGSVEAAERLLGSRAELVVANLTAEVLLTLGEQLPALVAPGGILIGAGIVAAKADEVQQTLEATGMATEARRRDGEWVALALRRNLHTQGR